MNPLALPIFMLGFCVIGNLALTWLLLHQLRQLRYDHETLVNLLNERFP